MAAAGHRVIAPDLIGFGKSDKPASKADYSYAKHVAWVEELGALAAGSSSRGGCFSRESCVWFIFSALCFLPPPHSCARARAVLSLGLSRITLVCQDWGGLIGLRVLTLHPHLFSAACVANTGLPTGEAHASKAFLSWQAFAARQTDMPIGTIVSGGCNVSPSDEVIAAYDAPYPAPEYKAGAHVFPALVPTSPGDPEGAVNARAWEALRAWRGKVHVCFSDGDAITRGAEKPFLALPCCASHTVLAGGGHFLQEDVGPEFAQAVLRAMRGGGPHARL